MPKKYIPITIFSIKNEPINVINRLISSIGLIKIKKEDPSVYDAISASRKSGNAIFKLF
jgi:hypothetical protein